jgi:hypothetical protein
LTFDAHGRILISEGVLLKVEPKARVPKSAATDVQGDFAQFTNFMRRLVAVPHSKIKAELDREKREKKSKTSSSRVPASS